MSNESRKVPIPDGFDSWLEYAVVSFDTRSAQLPFLFDFDEENPITRDEIHAASGLTSINYGCVRTFHGLTRPPGTFQHLT